MIESRFTPKRFATRSEIEEITNQIESRFFPRLIIFSDIINRYVDIVLKDHVNWLWVDALMILSTRNGILTIGQLAHILLRSNHAITKLVDSLEENGLVKRRRMGKDRRTIHIQLTSGGIRYMLQIMNKIDMAEKALQSCMEHGEENILLKTIDKISEKLVEKTNSVL
jgi:DNA-binding MarR family transcriptional regulator